MATAGNIKNMHYDFKQKLNRLDSAKYIGLQIPQIDWRLNEALNLYVQLVAEPRVKNQLGFETLQRTTDDIAPVVMNGKNLTLSLLPGSDYTLATLPNATGEEYMYYLSSKVIASKDDCLSQELETNVIQHDDRNERREFYKSDFNWRECNIRFFDGGIKIFHNDFTVNEVVLDYIRKHPYIHNAEDFVGATYNLPDGRVLTNSVDCELPDVTHSEIVDLAVLLTTGDLVLPLANQLQLAKVSIKQLVHTNK